MRGTFLGLWDRGNVQRRYNEFLGGWERDGPRAPVSEGSEATWWQERKPTSSSPPPAPGTCCWCPR